MKLSARPLFLILALLALTAAASLGSWTVSGAEAGHDVTPAAPAALPNGVDACGVESFDVPDSGAFFDFYDACVAHDTCYGAGGTPADRRNCDNAFLQDMLTSCSDDGFTGLNLRKCRQLAFVYYAGVRLAGWLTFFP